MSKDASGNPADPSNNTSAQSNQDQETGSGERTPRPSTRREISDVSSRQTEPSPRFQLPRPLHDTSTNEASRLISRDFADQEPLRQLRSVRSVASSRFRQPSIRRRLDSTHPSPSPGPSLPWRQFIDSDRRSVAIASGREDDLASHRTFSLAGPPTIDSLLANQTYVDPGYVQLNPAYDQPSNTRPVWGLAKPLPHVLRPGMVPTKEELKKEVLRAEDEPDSAADLEEGRIEPSLRPGRIAAQLDDVRRDREIGLFEAFQQHGIGSPGLSPFARHSKEPSTQHNVPPDIRSPLAHPIYEEDEEQTHRPSDPELHGLTEAVSQTNRLKEEREELKLPYQDVIPLTAYEAENDEIHNLHTYWSVVRLRFREPLAELLGITVQYTLGFSANLALTVSRGTAGAGDTGTFAWGFATMIAIYIAGGISGAHLNPAISIMLYIYRGFPLAKLPSYFTAQIVGAFLATLITFIMFQPGLIALHAHYLTLQDQQHLITPKLSPRPVEVLVNFLTFPRQIWVSNSIAFFTEVVGTTILAISVLALGDDTNAPPGAGMNAFIVGLLIVVLGMAFGYNTGLAMNPARDFGPRLALTMLGYSSGPNPSLWAAGYWFKVNWCAPICGTILGGFLYDSMIFVGGESPVNYPMKRIRRAVRKWRMRWRVRFGRTKLVVEGIKDEVVG